MGPGAPALEGVVRGCGKRDGRAPAPRRTVPARGPPVSRPVGPPAGCRGAPPEGVVGRHGSLLLVGESRRRWRGVPRERDGSHSKTIQSDGRNTCTCPRTRQAPHLRTRSDDASPRTPTPHRPRAAAVGHPSADPTPHPCPSRRDPCPTMNRFKMAVCHDAGRPPGSGDQPRARWRFDHSRSPVPLEPPPRRRTDRAQDTRNPSTEDAGSTRPAGAPRDRSPG